MDEADIRDFQQTYETQVKAADRDLQFRREFVDAGIHSYEDSKNVDRDDEEQREQAALTDKVMFEEEVDLFWELQERERLIDFHHDREAGLEAIKHDVNEKGKERIDQRIALRRFHVYPGVVIRNFKDFIFNVAIAVIISVVMVIMPVFMRDRSQQLLDLQYTTEKGRNVYKTKVVAGLISTWFVITALLIAYFGLCALNKTSMFFRSSFIRLSVNIIGTIRRFCNISG